MKRIRNIVMMGLLVLLVTGCGVFTLANKKVEYLTGKHYVEMSFKDYGKVELELDADMAPITVTNFMELVKEGFYDGNRIHRIDNDLGVIQGGQGTGKEEKIVGEFLANGVNNTISHKKGVISMARSGDGYDTGSTQFFITTKDATALDNYYAAFGKVTKGMDAIEKMTKKKFESNSMGALNDVKDMPIIEYVKEIEK